MHESKDKINLFNFRTNIITVLILAGSFLLIFRVWDLQVLRGEEFQSLSERNRLRNVRVIAPRGNIYDRRGNLLAYDSPSFNLYATKEDIDDLEGSLELICQLLNYDYDKVMELKNRLANISIWTEYPLIKNLSFDEIARIESRYSELPGFSIKIAPIRKYDYADAFVHVLGYMREIDKANLDRMREYGYRMGDYIGVSGVERSLNILLKGMDGNRIIEVDALGREVLEISSQSPKRGNNAYLTIDRDFQLYCHDLMNDHKAGSIIVMDLETGNLLVLISKPGFDPNIFFPDISLMEWQELVRNPLKPLQDRSVAGLYSPGSVFKTVMALAGLNEGIINDRSAYYCGGGVYIQRRVYSCWNKAGHGNITVRNAIAESCNVYFYHLGDKLGIERIHDYSRLMGLGQKTGIILPNESPGIVPNHEWKMRTMNEPWYPGETISVSIGQGSLAVTPIQLAVMMGFIATEGNILKPRLISEIEDYRGLTVDNNIDDIMIQNKGDMISSEYFQIVKEGLEGAFSYPRGTARRAYIKGFEISGKTGTSQVAALSRLEQEDRPYHLRNHSLLVSFAKKSNPSIAVVVFIAHGGEEGSRDRVDITKNIYEYYFENIGEN